MAAQVFVSPFLDTFKILPWDTFDDGAQGNVFRVERRRGITSSPVNEIETLPIGCQFIVKLVKLPSLLNENPSSSSMREVELLKTYEIEDENVIRIFGSWEENPPIRFEYPNRPPVNEENARILFILMEYCDIFTLRRWLGWPREKRCWNDLVNLFVQVTKGLVCIHQKRIIHRDLKPSNIGLKCDWEEERVIAKLIDFGLATKYRDVMTSTVGTYLYRSPEIHQRGKVYDEKADIYTLGIILCQMMASLWAVDVSVEKLEDEFRQFVEDSMDSTLTPLPFDSFAYLRKYGFEEIRMGDNQNQILQLAAAMTSRDPQARPSSNEILNKVRAICPEGERTIASIYNYLEEVKERQVGLSVMNCMALRPIKTSRLNHLTHLTLKNIQLTKMELLEISRECLVLTDLSLSLRISDLGWNELLPLESIHLPKLKTFRFRSIDIRDDYKTQAQDPKAESQFRVSRIQSFLFFGPISQIWDNQMRVKVSQGKRVLIDVDSGANKSSFFLGHIDGGFDFMEILNHLPFENVTIMRLLGKSPEENLDLDECWSLENKSQCSSLYLSCSSVKYFHDGRLFESFSWLKELTLFGTFKFPFKVIKINLLPKTITKLFLKWIQPRVDGMKEVEPRKLESLKMSICEVPGSFYEKYDTLFEVEDLRVSCAMTESAVTVIPGFSYVETFLNTSNWKQVTLDPFDWRETPENSEFRKEFISDFFSQEDEETLQDQGIVLKWIDGNPVAALIDEVQFTKKNQPIAKALSPLYTVDSDDDDEAELMVQQNLEDYLKIFDMRKIVCTGIDELDNQLPENFYFKGALSSPTYPQTGWGRKITFEAFEGITSKSKAPLRHIKLRNCKVNSLRIQLRGCSKLQSLILEMVQMELEERQLNMTPKFPDLKTYYVNLYSESLPGGLPANHFSFDGLDRLFFFRSFPERMKGLWSSGISCSIRVQGISFFEMAENSLSLEFLPDVDKILNLLGLNETLLSLKVHCCLFPLSSSVKESLPTSVTKLILKYVSVAVTEISHEQFPNLKTLVFEGHDFFSHSVNLKNLEKLSRSLEQLTLCNVSLFEVADDCELSLNSLTLSRVSIPYPLKKAFFSTRNFKSLVLADIHEQWRSLETLHTLLLSSDTDASFEPAEVTFINFVINPEIYEPIEESINQMKPLCQSFFIDQRITGTNFTVTPHLEKNTNWKWKAIEIYSPDESDDHKFEGYIETRPFFPKKDTEKHMQNFNRLRERLTLPRGFYPDTRYQDL